MKIAGMIVVFAGCAAVGIYYRMREMMCYRTLMELMQGMMVIQGEIASVRTPLPDAVFQAAKRTRGTASAFLNEVCERLEERSRDVKSLWEDAVRKYFDHGQLKNEDLAELIRVGEVLGYLDVEMQLQSIRRYQSRLEAGIHRQQKEVEKKAALYPALGAAAGILCCLVFV